MTLGRTIRSSWIALVLGSLLLVGLPGMARAHGALRKSVPASGARLATVPRELRLTFNERVELAVARLELLGPDSQTVALSPVRAGTTPMEIVADVTGPLVAGTYTVVWQVAGRDGHPVHGRFRFTVAANAAGLSAPPATSPAAAVTPPADSATAASDHAAHAEHAEHAASADPNGASTVSSFDAGSPWFAVARWLGFVATLGLTGAAGFALLVAPRARARGAAEALLARVVDRARALGLLAALLLVVAALLRLAAQSAALRGAGDALGGPSVGTILGDTTWGTAWLVQVAGALVAAAALAVAGRRPHVGWPLAAAGVGAVAIGSALSGHAAAVGGVAVAADAVHVLAAGGWLGTLLVLVAAGLATLRTSGEERAPTAVALVNAFSPVALTCAALLLVTGAAAAWWNLGSVAALGTSAYGRTLLVKLAVLSLIGALGAYNWRRVRPAVGEAGGVQRLRRTAGAELLVGALVLAITAVLVAVPTPLDAVR